MKRTTILRASLSFCEEVDDTYVATVGCIYASNPQFKSNILQFHFILFKSIVKTSKQPKNIFSIFSVFLLTFIVVIFRFLHAIYFTKVCVFAPTSRFDSELRKCPLACWLHPTIWPPDGQGAKGPGKQVYASETCCYSLSKHIYRDAEEAEQELGALEIGHCRPVHICVGTCQSLM